MQYLQSGTLYQDESFNYTVERRYNERPRDWQNLFALMITRFRYIYISRFFFIYFAITGVKKIVRYTEVPLQQNSKSMQRKALLLLSTVSNYISMFQALPNNPQNTDNYKTNQVTLYLSNFPDQLSIQHAGIHYQNNH